MCRKYSQTIWIPKSIAATMLLLLSILTFASCSQAASASNVALKFAPGHTKTSATITKLDEEGSFVLRCASVTEDEQGITIAASKSKNVTAYALIFVRLPETAGNEVTLAAVPITGKEYEYDMTRASLYIMTYQSAEAAVRDYGIPFLDWQTGACSATEKFPCCE